MDPLKNPFEKNPYDKLHKTHSELTEKFENFNKQAKKQLATLLIATGLTAFLVWSFIIVRLIDSPYNILTVIIWLICVYLVYKLRN